MTAGSASAPPKAAKPDSDAKARAQLKPDPVQAAPAPVHAEAEEAQRPQAAAEPQIAKEDKHTEGAAKRAAHDAAATAADAGTAGKGAPLGGVATAIPPNTNKVEERELLPFFDTGSAMMDEILEHSLARVLEVIEGLESKVEMKGGHAPDGTPVK